MIFVLNLLDVKKGCEADYALYLRRVQSVLDRHGASVVMYGKTRQVYMGLAQQEYCGIVCYPNTRALRNFSNDPEFLEIRPLRDDSTDNYFLTVIEGFPALSDAIDHLEAISHKTKQGQ